MIRGNFEHAIVWSEIKMSAQSSGWWSGFGLGHGCAMAWRMIWFRSDQRSFPSCKVWPETVSSALRAHTVFRVHFSPIKAYFGMRWSDQRSLPDGIEAWVAIKLPALKYQKYLFPKIKKKLCFWFCQNNFCVNTKKIH